MPGRDLARDVPEDTLAEFDDQIGSFGDLDENDPRSVAQFVKKMGSEMGEDLGPDLDEAMDEAMAEGGGDAGGEEPVTDTGGGAGDDSEAL